jgi:RNA polymerase primary sigma factor
MRSAIAFLAAVALVGLTAPVGAGTNARGHSERLAARARRGDRLARATLVEENMGLVRAVAWRYRGLGLPTEDLVQEGAIGLLAAADDYEADRGASFSTYAYLRIRAAMTHALTTKGSVIRVPRTAGETGPRFVHVSLDQPLADGTQPSDRLPDDPSSRPDAQALRKLEARDVRAALRRLGSRQRSIVSRNFGIGGQPETLREIAADLRLSPSRTQVLKDEALEKLASDLARAV